MAVSATDILSSPIGASIFTSGAAQDGAATGGDSFADILATLENAATAGDPTAALGDAAASAAATPVIAPPVAATPVTALPPAADAIPTAGTDTDDVTDAAAATPTLAVPQTPFYKDASKDAGKIKAEDAEPAPAKTDAAANDNSAAQPPQWLPQQPVTPPPQPTPNAASETAPVADAVAPQAGNAANAPAPQQPGQVAANDADSGDADAAPTTEDAAQAAATAQAGKTAPKAGAKPAKPSDFKKALDEAKAAPSKTGPAPATGSTAKQADARTDNANSQAANAQADAAPAAPQPAPAAHGAQDNAAGTAAVANAAPANADPVQAGIATATPHAAADTHHAPNLNSLAVDIAARSQSGTKQFDIRLDPPELGRVEVRLSIDATGKAQAHLTADQPQTLDLLQKDAATLTRALRDAGLDVAHDGLNFSLRNQQQQAGQDQNQGQGQGGRAWRGAVAVPAANDAIQAASAYRGAGNTLLDIKV